MRLIFALLLVIVLVFPAIADMEPGEMAPNTELESMDGEKTLLHDLFNQVSVIHLWKCK